MAKETLSELHYKMRHSRWHEFVYVVAWMGLILPLLIVETGSYSYDNYYNNASMKQLRFHDFEPRQQQMARMAEVGSGEQEMPTQSESKTAEERQARGFHFNALGDDVNVEMEFIIPFIRVPVRRSMKLARDALQNLLNLHTGALLNTAVIVAAGAIIAAIVRLVLAPMVFTSMLNAGGYGGYLGKDTVDEVPQISRGSK